MKASEVIREGRSLLFEDGWNQGGYQSDGKLCSLGALRQAATGTCYGIERHPAFAVYYEAATFVARSVPYALPSYKPDGVEGWVVNYNDRPGMTFAEIIELFDQAEKAAEQAEAV